VKEMMTWLVCGSRSKRTYKAQVFEVLDEQLAYLRTLQPKETDVKVCIITGGCPGCADEYALEWGDMHVFSVIDVQGSSGHNLQRNINMVKMLTGSTDEIFAFWDGFSYGTAQTIAQGVLQGRTVNVFEIKKGV